jgi:hypothetical protein
LSHISIFIASDVLKEAGGEVGAAFHELIGAYNAAMTAVQVTALIEDRAKGEIAATAVIPD